MAAIAVHVTERCARGRRCRHDARRTVLQGLWQTNKNAFRYEIIEINDRPRLGFGVQRARISIRRQLQHAESQDFRAASLVACLAVVDARDRVRARGTQRIGTALALFGDQ